MWNLDQDMDDFDTIEDIIEYHNKHKQCCYCLNLITYDNNKFVCQINDKNIIYPSIFRICKYYILNELKCRKEQ